MLGLWDWDDRRGVGEPDDQPGVAAGGDRWYAERHRYGAGRELSVAGDADRRWDCGAHHGGELDNDCSEDQRDDAGSAGGGATAGAEHERSIFKPVAADRYERAG